MNKTRRLLQAALLLISLLTGLQPAHAQTAQLQLIHNSPDTFASQIDIFVNNEPWTDSLIFRSATPYLSVPAGTLTLEVIPTDQTNAPAALLTTQISLQADQSYVAVLQGIVFPSLYLPNPDGLSPLLNLIVVPSKQQADNLDEIDYLFINGMHDAPALNFIAAELDTLMSDVKFTDGLAFGESSPYRSLSELSFAMYLTPATTDYFLVGRYPLGFDFFRGRALTVVSSGFYKPYANFNGSENRLLVVGPDGRVVAEPPADGFFSTARIQIINNAPEVNPNKTPEEEPRPLHFDVHFNGGVAIDSMIFRSATPYTLVPAGQTITVDIVHGLTQEVVASRDIAFETRTNYMLMITGLSDTTGYASNPDSLDQGITTLLLEEARIESENATLGQYVFINGIPDAPAIDFILDGIGTPVVGLPYNGMTDYLDLDTFFSVVLLGRPTGQLFPTIFRHKLDLPFVATRGFVMFTSGFLGSDVNQGGRAAKLHFAMPSGFVVDLADFDQPESGFSRLQLIHNAADPALDSVDVYVGDQQWIDNLGFRDATPFIPIPGDQALAISITPADATDVRAALQTVPFILDPDRTHIGVMAGVADPAQFSRNPDGWDTGINLYLTDRGREIAANPPRIDLIAFHGVPDAPAFRAEVSDPVSGTVLDVLSDQLNYSNFSLYKSFDPASLSFTFETASSAFAAVASGDFRAIPDGAGVVLNSGFIDSGTNKNGASYATFVVFPNGRTQILEGTATDLEADQDLPVEFALHGNYPNPFSTTTELSFDLPAVAEVSIEVYDTMGRRVFNTAPKLQPAGMKQRIQIDAQGLSSGMYLYRLRADTATRSYTGSGRLVLVK